MIWHDRIWYDMTLYYMTWYDMIWYGMTRYDMTWYDMTWFDMIWHAMIWYDMIWWCGRQGYALPFRHKEIGLGNFKTFQAGNITLTYNATNWQAVRFPGIFEDKDYQTWELGSRSCMTAPPLCEWLRNDRDAEM